MRKRFIALLMASLALCAGTLACGKEEETRKDEIESNAIRIYDVEPQEQEGITCVQHYARVGVLSDISDQKNERAPFANQIETIEKEAGADIEYLVFDDWEELMAAEKAFEDEKVTEMILFNNTFDGSIVKEASSGRYADMESALTDLGFYEEEAYNQMVLSAGIMENQQVLVPMLYNVSGMIHSDKEWYSYAEWKEIAYEHAEYQRIDYEEFLGMLTKAMNQADVEGMEIPFMTPGFLEERVDLFLMASGIRADAYERQEDMFTLLHNYLKTYQETQVECKEDKISNQMLYGQYLEEFNDKTLYADTKESRLRTLTDQEVIDLKLESISDGEGGEPLFLFTSSLMERTEYFVECSTAEKVAFHSVFGLLGYRDCWGEARGNGKMGKEFAITKSENMSYWPIGVLGSENEYAAQPICYAAVVDGGNTRLAATILQSMMNQPMDVKYGISTCNTSMEQQIMEWMQKSDRMGYVREIVSTVIQEPDGIKLMFEEVVKKAYWSPMMGSMGSFSFEDKEIYGSQIRNQIDHIVSAEIPDREILAIWQDTLTESVESGLTAQAGFELLCERMDAWYE